MFALSQLPSGSFDKLEKLLTIAGPPRYPDWVVLRSEALDEQWQQIDRALAEITQKTTKVEYLVIGTMPTGVIRVRRVDDAIEQEIMQRALPVDQIGNIDEWYKYFNP
ncbi:MAG TPA: hypothetical protein VFE24_14870 [Pirellulales bacterium]|nr:hypothetical protein [Pirellulales bacterium]